MPDKQKALPEELQVTALPTTALEAKLRTLREQSQKHSQALTQKLATSQSGQNLLHIGTSLSTLPPDLHSLLTQLHPLLSATEGNEKECFELLEKLVTFANDIRILQRRIDNAQDCAKLYEDLEASERDVKRDLQYRMNGMDNSIEEGGVLGTYWLSTMRHVSRTCPWVPHKALLSPLDEVDHVLSLERAAHTTLCLAQDLQTSTTQVSSSTSAPPPDSAALPSLRTPLDRDTERAQFLMRLAPRIRRLESDTITCLSARLESVLKQLQRRREENGDYNDKVQTDGQAEVRTEMLYDDKRCAGFFFLSHHCAI